ncbi:MAG: FAA hydrolase family protein, partial [Pseudomonadota bacterium]
MRFIVGTGSSGQGVFLVEGEWAWNLTAANESVGADLSALAAGRIGLESLEALKEQTDAEPVSSVTPGLPIERPGKIICLGLNYVDHIKEGGYDVPTYPALFMRCNTSM